MDITYNFNSETFAKLKFNDSRPVFVDCDENIEKEEIEIIEKVVEYYNDIFSTINKTCKFRIKDNKNKVKDDDTVITIKNGEAKD